MSEASAQRDQMPDLVIFSWKLQDANRARKSVPWGRQKLPYSMEITVSANIGWCDLTRRDNPKLHSVERNVRPVHRPASLRAWYIEYPSKHIRTPTVALRYRAVGHVYVHVCPVTFRKHFTFARRGCALPRGTTKSRNNSRFRRNNRQLYSSARERERERRERQCGAKENPPERIAGCKLNLSKQTKWQMVTQWATRR